METTTVRSTPNPEACAPHPALDIPDAISKELKLSRAQVKAVLTLFDDGCTVPFIARYRKEATGSLDETVITAIRDRAARMAELDKRRAAILDLSLIHI